MSDETWRDKAEEAVRKQLEAALTDRQQLKRENGDLRQRLARTLVENRQLKRDLARIYAAQNG